MTCWIGKVCVCGGGGGADSAFPGGFSILAANCLYAPFTVNFPLSFPEGKIMVRFLAYAHVRVKLAE